jgi:uncharacterized membrane protein YgaE (UPF0421/DUF939 family)
MTEPARTEPGASGKPRPRPPRRTDDAKQVAHALRSLEHPVYLAVKAGLATALALGLDHLADNPDHVSSTFVAVLCISPTVIVGLRRAASQLLGSLIGGSAGTLAILAGLPPEAGVPLAVGVAVGIAFAVRLPLGYPVAAFTALFVQLVPLVAPAERLEVRLLAIAIAGLSGFAVNVLFSSHAYARIYARRVGILERAVLDSLGRAARWGPDAVQHVFRALGDLKRELDLAVEEVRWRRDPAKHDALTRRRQQVMRLRQLLHVASELGYQAQERGLDDGELADLAAWLAHRDGPMPAVPGELEPAALRLLQGLRRDGHLRDGAEAASPPSAGN